MKTIIVSDIHLTAKFDKNKFDFLKKLFQSCDKLIINGDFWSCYSSTFDEFINPDWKQLFPIMLAKNTSYLYGNHDKKEFMDQRVNLFSIDQNATLEFAQGKNNYHVEHGHLFFHHKSISNHRFMELNRNLKIDEIIRRPLDNLLLKKIGVERLSKLFRFTNKKIKDNGSKIFQNKIILVTGHTHLAESDLNLGYVNTGFIDHKMAWYLEISDDKYELKYTKY